MYNLIESGYLDGNVKWVLGGKVMVWFSDCVGYCSYGSWGVQYDVYIMFFDVDVYDCFCMNKEDFVLFEEVEKVEKVEKEKVEKKKKENKKDDKKKDVKEKNKKDGDEEKKEEVKFLKFDFDNWFDCIVCLIVNFFFMGDVVLILKGDKFYYLVVFESGYDLWEYDLKENFIKILLKGVGGGLLLFDKKGENIFMCIGGGMKKIEIVGSKIILIVFEFFFDYQLGGECVYIFDYVWQQVDDKFYVKDL